MFRELATRYGRNNIGFLWLIAEPLIFCGGVFLVWTLIRPPFQHGLPVLAFLITGYLPLTLLRHMISQSISCVHSNAGLLYHRQITLLHMFLSRAMLEVIGVSLSFLVVVLATAGLGLVDWPRQIWPIYAGWSLLVVLGLGLGLVFGALSAFADWIERFVSVLTYLLIPASGVFVMVDWLPPTGQRILLLLPFAHGVELIRQGFFGEFVRTHSWPAYALAWCVVLICVGLLLLRVARERVEVE